MHSVVSDRDEVYWTLLLLFRYEYTTMNGKLKRLTAILLFGLFSQNLIAAYHPPTWELGVATGYLHTPEYRGAAKSHNYLIPFPYAAYRGHRLRIDEDGVRSTIAGNKRWKLDMRFAGNVPIKSRETSKRAGMKTLAPVLEFGPSLEYFLWQNDTTQSDEIWMRLPLRFMTSVGLSRPGYEGWSFAPYIEYVKRLRKTSVAWNIGIAFGPLFSNSDYNNYFYKVDDSDVSSTRTQYDAALGYSGTRVTLTIIGNSRHFWYGMFARYDNMQEAVFSNSPLIETDHYTAVGISLGWKFLISNERAK